MALISLLIPLILEVLKIFFGSGASSEKEKAAREILDLVREVRAALDKAEETGGDTGSIEDQINRPRK